MSDGDYETDQADAHKPCGSVHPLPCGLDVECPVPVKYFDAEKTSNEIYEAYESDHNQQ